jgi:hypothetical protein
MERKKSTTKPHVKHKNDELIINHAKYLEERRKYNKTRLQEIKKDEIAYDMFLEENRKRIRKMRGRIKEDPLKYQQYLKNNRQKDQARINNIKQDKLEYIKYRQRKNDANKKYREKMKLNKNNEYSKYHELKVPDNLPEDVVSKLQQIDNNIKTLRTERSCQEKKSKTDLKCCAEANRLYKKIGNLLRQRNRLILRYTNPEKHSKDLAERRMSQKEKKGEPKIQNKEKNIVKK